MEPVMKLDGQSLIATIRVARARMTDSDFGSAVRTERERLLVVARLLVGDLPITNGLTVDRLDIECVVREILVTIPCPVHPDAALRREGDWSTGFCQKCARHHALCTEAWYTVICNRLARHTPPHRDARGDEWSDEECNGRWRT